MKKAIILVGCSGSGKSTWATEYTKIKHAIIVERDRIRQTIMSTVLGEYRWINSNMWKYWNFKNEKLVDEQIDSILSTAFRRGEDIIVSDTNINIDRRNKLIEKFESNDYNVEVIPVGYELTLEELWKRNNLRQHSVGHDVVAKQYEQFRKEFPLYPNVNPRITSLPKAVIFDVDGTLAHMSNRSPFEWSKVGDDKPDDIIFSSLIAQHLTGNHIIIMSGRDSICREETTKWLNHWFRYYLYSVIGADYRGDYFNESNLFMRPEGSMVSDVIVKHNLFMEYVNGKYNVLTAFDDRPKVCRGWYDLGLRVIHCGNPYVEF